MQIGSSLPPFTPAPSASTARPLSPEVSPDIARADQAPVAASQEQQADSPASGRDEADRDASPSSRAGEPEPSPQEQRQQQLEITDLVQRDREVRTHEQAHAAVGGQYAGAPTYSFKRGPDGQRYAVSGEVGIDTSPVPNDPEATLRKMEIVLRAALAPIEPSPQDMRVASLAQAQAAQARVELAELRRAEATSASEEAVADDASRPADEQPTEQPQQASPPAPNLDLYRRLGELPAPQPRIDLVA
ncbi:putative metalloprotease CJM1_0395 family protein [Ectopseudomonas composti]|uniref:putative metalloprotease CJM1_0395 family protein n=1 Tax=Ectopseudomonas composti TaxID=658457 RepID=UPI000774786E|nr:putative metalloprotease CJM1_0395 family protein [Pseudomonas composti]